MNKDFFMNYAEGQGVPTVKYDNETATNEAKIAPKDITKRVKTYKDACAILGVKPITRTCLLWIRIMSLLRIRITKDEIAYRKLKTIVEALNEGWKPDWTNSNQRKYWPWFLYNPNSASFRCADASLAASYASTYFGSPHCFKTRELATYAGTQFIDIYNELILIK